MQGQLTPDWAQVCGLIRIALAEALETMDMSLEDGADPMYVAADVLAELKLAFATIESNPDDALEH
jgi:hypothetical protein